MRAGDKGRHVYEKHHVRNNCRRVNRYLTALSINLFAIVANGKMPLTAAAEEAHGSTI